MLNRARKLTRYVPYATQLLPPQTLLSSSILTYHARRRKIRPFTQYSPKSDQPRIEYNWIRGVEDLQAYQPGGYHPLMIGDKLQDGRYQIVGKLGYGDYSTIWLTHDSHLNRYLALKVNTASAVPREPKVLRALASASPNITGRQYIPDLLDEFQVHGPNGIHTCYTLPIAACNLRDLPTDESLLPLDFARVLCYSLTKAIGYVHSQGYVHGDLHLNNVLLTLVSNFDHISVDQFHKEFATPLTIPVTQRSGDDKPLPPNVPAEAVQSFYLGSDLDGETFSKTRLVLSGFGEAFNPFSETRLGKGCRTPPGSRAPEAAFEPDTPLTDRSDIWSLATALWEIIGMEPIFIQDYDSMDVVLAQHIDILGPMPSTWWEKWEARDEFFISPDQPAVSYTENMWPPLDAWFEKTVQEWRRGEGGEIGEEEKVAFLDLMRRMLAYRPGERPTADEVLQSEWMVKWALPEYERSLNDSS